MTRNCQLGQNIRQLSSANLTNFRDEAESYQQKLNKYFPKGVFIMNDIIEVKADDANTSRL